MDRETLHDRWTPETPVKRTDDEGESFLSLADAAKRLVRNGVEGSEGSLRLQLAAGRHFHTATATYQLVTAVTA